MRILITSDWYSPAVNGVVTSVKNLRQELECRGHDVRILTLSQTRQSWEEDGVIYLGSIPAGRIYPGARVRTALAGRYIRELLEWGPDIVHSQCEFSTFFLARRISETLESPLIHTYHTVYEDYTHYLFPSARIGKKAVAVFSRWFMERTDCVIVPTEKVRRLLQGYGVRQSVRVVPSGIDLCRFSEITEESRIRELKERVGIPTDRFVMVSVGRLAEEKNVEELLRYRATIGTAPVTLLLVGDGPDRCRLEQKAAELGLAAPDIVFAGMVPPEEITAWYQLGEVFVSASTSETQGLTYVEALAAGVPVLCREDPCLDEVIREGENGWRYENEADFLRKLNGVLRHREKLEELSQNARKSARTFSAALFARRVEEVYQEQIWRYKRNRRKESA